MVEPIVLGLLVVLSIISVLVTESDTQADHRDALANRIRYGSR